MEEEVVGGSGGGVELEAQAHPAITGDGTAVVDGGDGIGEDEEVGVWPVVAQAVYHQVVFVVHHFVDAALADVAAAGFYAINLVGVDLIVGTHRLGDRTGGGTDLKEIAGHFLPRPDFGEGAVDLGVQVDFEGLLVGF